jgi:hypothetical protein
MNRPAQNQRGPWWVGVVRSQPKATPKGNSRLTHGWKKDMADQNSFSEYQQAARLKWPTALITGDGSYALHCADLNHVWLYTHYMLAMADVAQDHGNWSCKDSHRLIELKPAPCRKITHGPDSERD